MSCDELDSTVSCDGSEVYVPSGSAGGSSWKYIQPRDRCFLKVFHLENKRRQEAQ